MVSSLVHQIIPPSVPGAPAPAVPPAITAKGAEVAPAEPASLMGTGTLAARNSMAQAQLDDENMDFGKAWLEEEARVPKAHELLQELLQLLSKRLSHKMI